MCAHTLLERGDGKASRPHSAGACGTGEPDGLWQVGRSAWDGVGKGSNCLAGGMANLDATVFHVPSRTCLDCNSGRVNLDDSHDATL
jgi:hypothetical protein